MVVVRLVRLVGVWLSMVPKSNWLFVYGWHDVGVRCAGVVVWGIAISFVNLLHENHTRIRRTNTGAMLSMVLEYLPTISRLTVLQLKQ